MVRTRNLQDCHAAIETATDACVLWRHSTTKGGYPRVYFDGRMDLATRAVLVLSGRPVPSSPGDYALHSCDTPSCINPRHLRWGTQGENMIEAMQRDRVCKGESNNFAKLTLVKVERIRAGLAEGRTQRELAQEFGTTQANISCIALGKSWRRS